MNRKSTIIIIGLAALWTFGISPLLSAQSDPPVSLLDTDSTVTLSNGQITGMINKSNARMTTLYKGSSSNLIGNAWYWDCNGNGGLYEGVANAAYSVVTNTDDQVEIAFQAIGMLGGVLDYEVHYILRRGVSGFYAFAVLSTSSPAEWDLDQARCVVRNSPAVFNRMVVDDNRQKVAPTPQELALARANGGILSPSEATRMPDGTVDDKYLFADYVSEHYVHGWCGDGYGMWMITPSSEFYNGGPTHQELTVHQTTTTPVILNDFQGSHYGGGQAEFQTGERWSKIYGPFFLYVNEGDTPEEQWDDAKAAASLERQKWPYQWLDRPDYPLDRGNLVGKLKLTDGTNPTGAWVILASPENLPEIPNWQKQCKGYQFYARADEQGNFKIEQVRPGTYSLYAFVNGIPEEYRLDDVVITAGQTADLGILNWSPQKFGRRLWQIGRFDRTAGEYKYGDRFHDGTSWGMWNNYLTDFPADVDIWIGRSCERDDWNYTQMACQRENGSWHLPVWVVHFDIETIPVGQAMLTVAIAAQRQGALEIRVNGIRIEYDTSLDAGSACVRDSIQGAYELKRLKFNTTYLRQGINTISFKQVRGSTFANIMYDAIRLELPLIADLNHDSRTDAADLAVLVGGWLDTNTGADLDKNGQVDYADFNFLTKEWLSYSSDQEL